jgi:hypothetical protein
MAKHKTRRPVPYKPAIGEAKDKGVVVSAQRARWKEAHSKTTPEMIRMVRFIWMRMLHWEDRNKLHARVLGACMRAGLVWREPNDDKSTDKIMCVDYRRLP